MTKTLQSFGLSEYNRIKFTIGYSEQIGKVVQRQSHKKVGKYASYFQNNPYIFHYMIELRN